jgi:gliding motility-associated-like protein
MLQWSTVFGTGIGRPNISITAFTVDVCNRIYLSGWGREWSGEFDGPYTWTSLQGTKNMLVTPDAYQSVTDGQDFYVMVMADDASQIEYGSFFGEQHGTCVGGGGGYDHVDGGTSRFDKKGNIYQSVCASCGGCDSFPTSPGNVWSQTNNAGNCNNAVFRFSFMGDFSIADFLLPPAGCLPYTVSFTNTSIGANNHWDFGDGNTSTAMNPSHTYYLPGTYNVTLIVSDSTTCNLADTIIKQVQVLSNSNDTLAIANVCIGDSVQIGLPPGVDPNVTYHWFPQTGLSNPNISNPWAMVSGITEYLLVRTNGSCSDSLFQTVNVQVGNYSLAARADTIVCSGSGVELFATTSFPTTTFLWSNSLNFLTHINTNTTISNFTVHPTTTTTYYIKGNGVGCEGSGIDSVTVQINQVAINAWPDTAICVGDTVTLHAQNLIPGNVLSYQWFPTAAVISGGNTANAVVSPNGTVNFVLIATTQYSCTKSDTVHVTVNSVTLTPVAQEVNCYGDCNGTATVVTIGAYPLHYSWDNLSTDSMITNLCPGTYQVTVTDGWGCKNHTSMQVIEPPLLISALQITPILVCTGVCTGQMIVGSSGGTSPYFYHWSNNSYNDTLLNLCVGNYQVTISDAHGCDTILSGQIVDPSTLQATVLPVSAISCHDDCNGSITAVAIGGQQPLTFHWNNNETTQTIDSLCSGVYSVSVIDAESCIRVIVDTVYQPQELNPFIISESSIRCFGDTTSLNAIISNGFPPYTFHWNDSLHQSTQSIHGVPSGVYQVVVYDSHNCPDSAIIALPNPALLVADTISKYASCTISCDGIIRFAPDGGTAPYTISWNDMSQDTLRTHLCPGNYTATVTDANGCSLIRHFYIDTLGYAPYVNATADEIVIYRGQTTILHANGLTGSLYTWSPAVSLDDASAVNPLANPQNTTHYSVWTVDSTGCKSSDTITIFVEDVLCREPYIFIPNAFTPNGDNKNDVLSVQTNMAQELYFVVYDRWGERVFESTNIMQGWDGTFKGKMLDPAVFVYYLKVTCLNGAVFEKYGNVTMLK